MRLFVIRHGQKATVDPEYAGGPNPPLTAVGRQQIEHLGEFMSGLGIDALYSSCQRRSLETAAAIHERSDCPWHAWPVFCETSTTRWGERYAEDPDAATALTAWPTTAGVADPTPDDVARHEDGGYYPLSDVPEAFPGAELSQPFPWPEAWWVPRQGHTTELGFARIELGLEALLSRHEADEAVAVACHGNCGDKMITTLMDMPRRTRPRRFAFNNAGVTRLDSDDDGTWRVTFANRRSHLPPDLRV